AVRCVGEMPVVGIGEAAFHMASLIAGKFSVVTTLSRSVPAIEHNLVRYGLASRCARVRASDVPVLELEVPGSNARHRISEEIECAIRDDRAEAIVLGCAGMADLAAALSREHGLPVLDGVACAVKLCDSLVGLGLSTSKRGGYQLPLEKSFAGIFAPFSPSGRAP
ncbi:aspartate/glutamate racemase family protein, partial [Mesorhizobium sp.]|uniref:aspartate/glutamate racemase family protein n=1 Tax=Mesorhizobium sp. TaxID=1871066 RepID=UPI00257C12F1